MNMTDLEQTPTWEAPALREEGIAGTTQTLNEGFGFDGTVNYTDSSGPFS